MADFDYLGYTDETLRRLCDTRRAFKGLRRRFYGQSEMYGIGQYYREEAAYPDALPLYVYSQHGANQVRIASHEIENDAEAMLVWNTGRLREYQKVSDKPCYVVTCPYISHRRRLGIVQAPGARGTLIFPAHSIRNIEAGFDEDNYIEEILALPAEFRPLAVCLYVSDVHRGAHRRYLAKGLPVYSAGDKQDVSFGDRLYGILRHFRYAMSNAAGSYAFYSVEMGIPFSLWGEEAKYREPVALDRPPEASGQPEPETAERLFTGIHTTITPEQRDFVEFSLGVGAGISGEALGKILWGAYRKRGRPVIDALTSARLRMKYAFQKLRYGRL